MMGVRRSSAPDAPCCHSDGFGKPLTLHLPRQLSDDWGKALIARTQHVSKCTALHMNLCPLLHVASNTPACLQPTQTPHPRQGQVRTEPLTPLARSSLKHPPGAPTAQKYAAMRTPTVLLSLRASFSWLSVCDAEVASTLHFHRTRQPFGIAPVLRRSNRVAPLPRIHLSLGVDNASASSNLHGCDAAPLSHSSNTTPIH